jgi:lysozyme
VGVPTIGWGSTGPDVKPGTRWTREQCKERLLDAMRKALAGVLRASPNVASDEDRAAALLDFAYNLGVGAYQGSTLRWRVNEGSWQEAAAQCRKWVFAGGRKLPGLVLRRELEALMLERGM